jgi:hypothetical protein
MHIRISAIAWNTCFQYEERIIKVYFYQNLSCLATSAHSDLPDDAKFEFYSTFKRLRLNKIDKIDKIYKEDKKKE